MQQSIKIIIVDDEPLALRQLASYIEKLPDTRLVAQCHSAAEALGVLGKHGGDNGGDQNSDGRPDLMFLDINMPDMNGLDFLKLLNNPPLVVFTTAYAEYAIEGYKYDAVDYLLKPFGLPQIAAAVTKARRRLTARTTQPQQQQTQTPQQPQQPQQLTRDTDIFVKCENRTVRLSLPKITYIEGMSEYVKIYMEGETNPLVPLLTMRKLEEMLPAADFMRIHRSYIINLHQIQEVSRFRIKIGGELLPVSDMYKEQFQQYMDNRTITK